jgi:membrane-anchored protein YejM (alkaline phosphatase superfamily)
VVTSRLVSLAKKNPWKVSDHDVVSVGQKTKGYVAGTLAFSPDLLKAMDFMDASLGAIVTKLKQKGLYEDTLIIVNSKHGQTPIDPIAFKEVDPKIFAADLVVPTFHTTVFWISSPVSS